MKKILLFIFSFFLSLTYAHAEIYLSDQVIDAMSLKSGDRIVIRDGSNWDRKKYLWSAGDSLIWFDNPDAIHSDAAFILEAVGDSLNGYPNYYLKSENNGQYVSYQYIPDGPNASIIETYPGEWEIYCRMVYTAEKSEAAPFTIAPSNEAKDWGYYGYPGEAVENTFMLLTPFHEFQDKTIYLSINYVMSANPGVGIYTDYATWMELFILNEKPSAFDDLMFLYQQVEGLNYVAGNGIGQYDPLLVADFNKYREEAMNCLDVVGGSEDEAARIHNDLKTAWNALRTAGTKPLTAGYYRIFSAFPAFKNNQGSDVEKAIYATHEGELRWKNCDWNDPTMGWEVRQNADGSWQMKNLGTQQFVSGVNSSSVTYFEKYVTSIDSIGHSIQFKSIEGGGLNIYYKGERFMHAGGHYDGAGVSGEIVGWDAGGQSASAWYLYPLSKDTAESFIKIGLCENKRRELSQLQQKAMDKYSKGWNAKIDTSSEHWLVTLDDYKADSLVVFSNADHNSWNPDFQDGAGYVGLLDEDSLTYWHSCWQNIPDEKPFLQFKLNKPVQQFAVYLNRRQYVGFQATQIDFYVSNDTTDVNGWIKAGSIKGLPDRTDMSGLNLTYQSDPIFMQESYQFVRVYWKSSNGFTHFAGFHFQNAEIQPNSLNYREDIRREAENLINVLEEINPVVQDSLATYEELTVAYEKLKAAYNAYECVLPDLTEVKELLKEIKADYEMSVSEETYADITEIYPDPGTYAEADREQLMAAVQSVEKTISDYEQSMSFTIEDVELLTQQLKDAYQTFKDKQRKIVAADAENAGVWYHIAASQRYYDITGKEQDRYHDRETMEVKYVRHGMLYIKPENDLMKGAALHVGTIEEMNANGVTDLDYATWRFVNVGDTAYAIQNKATGLFVSDNTNYGVTKTQLSVNPIFFKLDEIGYGTFVLNGYDMSGQNRNYLHVQTFEQLVCLWTSHDLGGGSCWDIYTTDRTEQGVPVGDYKFPKINYEKVLGGKLKSYAFPVGLECIQDSYSQEVSVYEVARDEEDGIVLSVKENNKVEAGEPFYYLPGHNEALIDNNDSLVVEIQVASDAVVASEKTVNGLVACYLPASLPIGSYILSPAPENVLEVQSSDYVYNQTNFAYLQPEQITGFEPSREILFLPYVSSQKPDYTELLAQYLEKSEAYLPYIGDHVGLYTDTVGFMASYNEALEKLSEATNDECRLLLQSLKSAMNALRLNLPDAAGTYRLRNLQNQYLVSAVSENSLVLSSDVSVEESAFFYGEDKHLTGNMKHLQLNGAGYAIDSTGLSVDFIEVSGVPGVVQIVVEDSFYLASNDESVYLALQSDQNKQDTYWHVEDISDKCVPAFDIRLQDYEGEGYATLCLPVAVKLAEGMEAYVGKVDGEYMKMTALEGNIVPPAVPVVIKGMSGEYQLPYDASAQTDLLLQNDLHGLFAEKAVAEYVNPYTLQIVDNQLGFFKYSGNSLNAFKAYLDLPAGKQIRGMVWDDSTVTGIDGLLYKDDVEIYDLSGRRVKDMKIPGVYIVNGKKVVIK